MLTLKRSLRLLLLCGALAAPTVAAQPSTDIHLGTLSLERDRVVIDGLRNITGREGYDNQPHFTPDGMSLLYTSIREDGQADTYRYDLTDGSVVQVTRTRESEYSPTIMPNGRHFSVVRVEADSTQRLWHFDLDGRNLGVLLEDVKPVGYHAWAGVNEVALYVLGPPPTLQLADLRTGRAEIVETGIGRSLHRVPGRRAISFVHSLPDDGWIKELDLTSIEVRTLVRTVPGNEHYAWTPSGDILMGSGSKLYLWRRESGGDWVEVADLAKAGISGITRIAVSSDGDRIAIVARR